MSFQQEVGEAVVGEATGTDQLDLEAAEQLIQLSGGDHGGSESRSADSVKCCRKEKDKEAAVESRRRRRRSAERFLAGKDGDGGKAAAGEPDSKGADSVSKFSRAVGMGEKEKELPVESFARRRSAQRFPSGKGGAAGVVDDGEGRRRPRFQWLADIYRETRPLTGERRAAGQDPPEGARRKKKRAAGAGEVIIPVVSEASKERTAVELLHMRV